MVRILLIDDDPNDRILFVAALEETGLDAQFYEATDGYAGLRYLFGDGAFANRKKYPLPDVVFLDVKMPGLDGFGVLRRLRDRPETKLLPVLMLSNSEHASDMQAAFKLGANAFYRKPTKFIAMVDLLRAVLTRGKGREHAMHAGQFE